jgi:hypothetical protein
MRFLLVRVCAVIALILAPLSLNAEDKLSPDQITAFNTISNEYAECSAYYIFAKQCAPKEATEAQLAQIQEYIESTSAMAVVSGKVAGMSDDALLARSRLAATSVAKHADNNCVNYSVLLEKYNDACRILREHPEIRGKQLKDQQNAK